MRIAIFFFCYTIVKSQNGGPEYERCMDSKVR